MIWGSSRRAWFISALVLGLGLRLASAAAQAGMYFPDEVYLYLEPPWWRLHGFGALTWSDDVGSRNWLLPAFYGGLMQIGERFGLYGVSLHRFLAFHDAIFSMVMVPAGF